MIDKVKIFAPLKNFWIQRWNLGEYIFMGIGTKNTTATNLQKALDQNLVTVVNAKVESKDDDGTKAMTPEQFKNDLDFYVESGVFTDSIDFKYELIGNDLKVYIGNMSSYCNVCITVEMVVNDGVSVNDLENVLKKVDLDIEKISETIRKMDRTLVEYPYDDSPENERKLDELKSVLENAKMCN